MKNIFLALSDVMSDAIKTNAVRQNTILTSASEKQQELQDEMKTWNNDVQKINTAGKKQEKDVHGWHIAYWCLFGFLTLSLGAVAIPAGLGIAGLGIGIAAIDKKAHGTTTNPFSKDFWTEGDLGVGTGKMQWSGIEDQAAYQASVDTASGDQTTINGIQGEIDQEMKVKYSATQDFDTSAENIYMSLVNDDFGKLAIRG
ncbi:MAG: hypothetical protein JW769_01115 [Parachlamydiales bacterium]|nr:hypothetical protein [Parachlamydiales bacterium]